MNVSIQGFEGSFHQAAAIKYFGKKVEVVCCNTFTDVVKSINEKQVDAGVMAIENSIAGSILPNYSLIIKNNLRIVGEVYLHIQQNLLVNKVVQLSDIKEVHSHPMAILQCLDYLEKYNWKLVETEDTALSAKHIHQYKSKHIAGIASKLAAETYDLEIAASSIQTMKKNYTRFLILQDGKEEHLMTDANKASINFNSNHTKGSLAKILSVIAMQNINLSKLQSMPIPGSHFEYSFHADLEFEKIGDFEKAMEKLKGLTEKIKILGIYKNGKL